MFSVCVAFFVSSVVVAVLRGPLSGEAGVTEQGLRAVGSLAANNDGNKTLLGTAGACQGKDKYQFSFSFIVRTTLFLPLKGFAYFVFSSRMQ